MCSYGLRMILCQVQRHYWYRITPQKTVTDGYSEAEFAKLLINEVFTPDTIATALIVLALMMICVRHLVVA